MQQTQSARILIVDDENDIRDSLSTHLGNIGFATETAANSEQARALLASTQIDLVLLDIMMPGEDGLSLCRHLHETSHVPVVLLTALADDIDRIVGLEVGADDYICKPFNPRELVARIKAVLRRTQTEPTERPSPRHYHFAGWRFDVDQSELCRQQDSLIVPLSHGEAQLLRVFLDHAGATLSRQDLMNLTRGRDSLPFERSIDNTISRLRRKIEDDPGGCRHKFACHCRRVFFLPARQQERSVVILHERWLTRLGGKIIAALRVAPKKAPLGVAPRSFGTTKRRSSRLDWRFFRHNSDKQTCDDSL
ncbi:MAG TPA: hypothetical protein DD979_05245, partial [Gammaproteobacteria bacterium]|nr:hypothetical protein [Gammaproteobacteria bacterium]